MKNTLQRYAFFLYVQYCGSVFLGTMDFLLIYVNENILRFHGTILV